MEFRFPLTVYEAAEYLKVSKYTIYRAIEKGRLKPNRYGKLYRLTKEDLEQWAKKT